MMKSLAAAIVAALLGGCAALSGENYVMSYGVEAGTDSGLRADSFTFSVSVSGR